MLPDSQFERVKIRCMRDNDLGKSLMGCSSYDILANEKYDRKFMYFSSDKEEKRHNIINIGTEKLEKLKDETNGDPNQFKYEVCQAKDHQSDLVRYVLNMGYQY